MHLSVLGGGSKTVYLDLIRDGQTLLTDTLDMQNGRGDYDVDIAADLSGTIELSAYRFGQDGLPIRKSRVLYIRPAEQLKVAAKVDQAEYRPGKRAHLSMALTDVRGRPVRGAISLVGVDEAVFSVTDQSAGMERTFFNLEKDLLQPIYTIYPSWSPDFRPDLPADEVNRFEQALFAKTATSEAPPTRRPNRGRGPAPEWEPAVAVVGQAAARDLYSLADRPAAGGREREADGAREPDARLGGPRTLCGPHRLRIPLPDLPGAHRAHLVRCLCGLRLLWLLHADGLGDGGLRCSAEDGAA
jgi:hypothetical protein